MAAPSAATRQRRRPSIDRLGGRVRLVGGLFDYFGWPITYLSFSLLACSPPRKINRIF